MEAGTSGKNLESNENSAKNVYNENEQEIKSGSSSSYNSSSRNSSTINQAIDAIDNLTKKSIINSYSRTCDPHTTDDSDPQSETSNSKHKRSLLKHRFLKKHYNNSVQRNSTHHNSIKNTISINNTGSYFDNNIYNKMQPFNQHQSQYSNYANQTSSIANERSSKKNSISPAIITVDLNNNDLNSSSGALASTVKPCLVNKYSFTSDEEIFSNHDSLQTELNIDNNNSNEIKQGILKQSKENETDLLFDENKSNNNNNNGQQNNAECQKIDPDNQHKSSFKPVNNNNNKQKIKFPSNSLSNVSNSNTKFYQNGNMGPGPNSNNITLVVDDTRFNVDPEIFKQHSNTMLGRMFNSPLENKPNERGEYVVAYGISSHIFKVVLDFYKHGIIRCPPSVSVQELKEACDYLLIPFDGYTVRCYDIRGFLNE